MKMVDQVFKILSQNIFIVLGKKKSSTENPKVVSVIYIFLFTISEVRKFYIFNKIRLLHINILYKK